MWVVNYLGEGGLKVNISVSVEEYAHTSEKSFKYGGRCLILRPPAKLSGFILLASFARKLLEYIHLFMW
jgi:hypothetical protein